MKNQDGPVLWFTGLSGSGKSTTARRMKQLIAAEGKRVELLDGDELRETICKGLGFSREDRMENIRRIVYLCKLLSRNGVTVLVSAITPYEDMRDYARSQLARMVEIYVRCSLQECERRDVKGLYAKARQNEIANFTGISDPYEEPIHPEIVIDTMNQTVDQNSRSILQWLAADEQRRAAEQAEGAMKR